MDFILLYNTIYILQLKKQYVYFNFHRTVMVATGYRYFSEASEIQYPRWSINFQCIYYSCSVKEYHIY